MDLKEPRKFKSKLNLAKELIDNAISKAIPFSSVVLDSWYASCDITEFVSCKNLALISEVKINRSIFFIHPRTKQPRYLNK